MATDNLIRFISLMTISHHERLTSGSTLSLYLLTRVIDEFKRNIQERSRGIRRLPSSNSLN